MDNIFLSVSEYVGVRVELDKARYFTLFMVSYPFAIILRVILHHHSTSTTVRHTYSLLLGLLYSVLCFGWQTSYLLIFLLIAYALLHILPAKTVHWYSLVYALGGSSIGHVYRLITDYEGYTLDFTGPLMLMVQRISYVGFSYNDGIAKKEEELNEDQKRNRIVVLPSILEYLSYNFSFLTLLAGPTCTYHEYNEMITGQNMKKWKIKDEPSSLVPALKKFLTAIFFLIIFINSRDFKLDEKILDDSLPFYLRFVYITLFCFVRRSGYYFTFITAESICNAGGLGFNGYDDSGKPQWDLVVGMNVKGTEIGVNGREQAASWNIFTAKWLRRTIYERVTIRPTIMAFIVSAMWHGFYPGYYICFIYLGLSVIAARKMRNIFWHRFQQPRMVKILYDIATTATTNYMVKDFSMFIFLFLSLEKSLQISRYYYYLPFIIVSVVAFLFPNKKAKRK